jgi:hypothetical protein
MFGIQDVLLLAFLDLCFTENEDWKLRTIDRASNRSIFEHASTSTANIITSCDNATCTIKNHDFTFYACRMIIIDENHHTAVLYKSK